MDYLDTRYLDLRPPPFCPACRKIVGIRWARNETAKCQNRGHKDMMHVFYAHPRTYRKLGYSWMAKIAGEED
jgi:hypothetical protein